MLYDSIILTRKFVYPVGDNQYYSKGTIYKIGAGEKTDILGETWGVTEEEAHNKMAERVKQEIKILTEIK